MEWFESLTEWAAANSTALWWLGAVSLALLLITPFVAGWLVVKLPADYFAASERRPLGSWDKYPALRVLLLVAKNTLGIVLLVAGLLMLVAPGQGLLTLVVGLVLVDFPGKFHFQRWLATRKQVWRSMNWLRRRAGKQELTRPTETK